METLGQKIRELRELRGLSQEQLAAKADVSRATVQNVENDANDTRQGKTVNKLAEALGVPAGPLLALRRGPPGRGAAKSWRRSPQAHALLDRLQAAAEARGGDPLALLDLLVAQAEKPVPTHAAGGTGRAFKRPKERATGGPTDTGHRPEGQESSARNRPVTDPA